MPNSIELIKKYAHENLDKIFLMESVTGILENRTGIKLKPVENDAKTVYIPDLVMSGLGNYSTTNGFPTGDITLKWTPYQCNMDRGRGFQIDAVEDAESAGITSANLMAEFERTKVIPEVDAYRLSKLYANAVEENIKSETIPANEIIKKFNDIIQYFQDEEIPTQNVVFFISSEIEKAIKNTAELSKQITQIDYKAGDITFKVNSYEGIPLITVPKARFKSEYTFGESGFAPSADAVDMSILAVHTNAALPYKKHEKVRVFSPDINQSADAWLFQYRLYHDIITPKNKQKGIYIITKPSN